MSDDQLAGFGGDWLPPGIAQRIAAEERAAQREAQRAEQEREALREAKHDRAMDSYRVQAQERGEHVSAIDLATGNVGGRTVADVFADAAAAAAREDARQASRDRREDVVFIDREPVLHGTRRSAWPESEYELDRLLSRADDLHSDLMAVRTRRNYGATVEAARAKSAGHARRSAPRDQGEIVRVCTSDGMTQLGTWTGGIAR